MPHDEESLEPPDVDAQPAPPISGGVVLLPDASELPTIPARRLVLRAIRGSDTADLFTIFSDSAVARYWSAPPLTDPAGAAALVEEIRGGFADRTLFQWGVAQRRDDRVIGTCTLTCVEIDHARAEVGFALAREAWGRGFMTEAMTALIDYAFDTLGIRRLEADIDPRNDRSLRLVEQLGFQREGLLRERWCIAGEIQDTAFYGLLAHEWEANRPSS